MTALKSSALVVRSAYVAPCGRFRTAITRLLWASAQSMGGELLVLAAASARVRLRHSPTTGFAAAVALVFALVVPPAYAGPVTVRATAAPTAARIRVRPEIVMGSSW